MESRALALEHAQVLAAFRRTPYFHGPMPRTSYRAATQPPYHTEQWGFCRRNSAIEPSVGEVVGTTD